MLIQVSLGVFRLHLIVQQFVFLYCTSTDGTLKLLNVMSKVFIYILRFISHAEVAENQ